MNPFLLIQAGLSVGAAAVEAGRGNVKLCIVYCAWAVSNAAMATIGGK